MPFLRLGRANDGGALWDRSVSVGRGYHLQEHRELAGFAVNCSRPSPADFGPGLRDQITMELVYRFQLTPELAITPDVEWVIHPSLAPERNHLWFLGLRDATAAAARSPHR